MGESRELPVTDRGAGRYGAADATGGPIDRQDPAQQAAVRVLPPHLVEEVIEAARAAPGTHPPKLLRPERLDHVADVVRLVRAGELVVLQVDRLAEPDQLRALDMASGAAAALDATISELDGTPGVSIAPSGHTARRPPAPPSVEPSAPPAPDTRDETADIPLCAFCELRPATIQLDPPLELVLRRDGSRTWAPPVGCCERCRRTVRNWRFAIAWCSQCERWGRRGVNSPCTRAYGS
jgi:hypothetical protein